MIAPKPNSEAGASKAIRLVGAIPTGAANTDSAKLARIRELAVALRRVAGGSTDWIWDAIGDMEDFVNGGRCIVVQTADEWIAYGERLLAKRTAKPDERPRPP